MVQDEELNKMAEFIVSNMPAVSPEYVGEMLSKAEASIESWLTGDDRTAALSKRSYARQWLTEKAQQAGYQASDSASQEEYEKPRPSNAYPDYIMKDVRQHLGLEPYDTSSDDEINNMTHDEVFDHVLMWDGIIGYLHRIRGWVTDIYGVTL